MRWRRTPATRLGAGAQILLAVSGAAAVTGIRFVADWDACSIKGHAIGTIEEWREIVTTGTLPLVEGAFALAWLDADGALSLARDAIGERTLYYARGGAGVVFASTLHAVLATGLVDRAINISALAADLTYAYLPGQETAASDVYEA